MATASSRRLAVLRCHLAERGVGRVDWPIASSSSAPSTDACPSSSFSSPAPRSAPLRVFSAAEAVADIQDGDVITVGGFVGSGFPEALVEALRARHDATGSPRRLAAVVVAAVGDGRGRGLGRLAAPALLSRLTYAWIGLCPEFGPLLRSGAIEGVNLPLGAVSHMIRDCAAGRPGPLSRVGVGTFVDPRERTHKGAASDDESYPVRVVEVGGVDFLHYRAPEAIDVALLRGSVADADGNVGFGREALLGDALNQAIAAHNSWHRKQQARKRRGAEGRPSRLRVIVQVESVLPASAPRLPARQVAIPGHLVDAVVIVSASTSTSTAADDDDDGSPSPSSSSSSSRRRGEQQHEKQQHGHHEQVIGVPEFERSLCGGESEEAVPRPLSSLPAASRPLPRGARRVVANRALLELLSSSSSSSESRSRLINVGVGMPEGVAALLGDRAATAALLLPPPPATPFSAGNAPAVPPPPPRLTLSTEAGALGGTPAGGRAFGASHDAAAHVPLPTMLDLYQGGAVAVAVLGMAEVGSGGDVNVSSFPGRAPGCGGFIDISQSARKVVFVGTFTSGGLHVEVGGGSGSGGNGSESKSSSSSSGGSSGGGNNPPLLLSITSEGRHPKFKASVGEVTFAGSSARGREIVYVTERAVFRLREEEGEGAGGDGASRGTRRKTRTVVELCEVAPGIDVERDVLGRMGFRPAIPKGGVRLMDARVLEGV